MKKGVLVTLGTVATMMVAGQPVRWIRPPASPPSRVVYSAWKTAGSVMAWSVPLVAEPRMSLLPIHRVARVGPLARAAPNMLADW